MSNLPDYSPQSLVTFGCLGTPLSALLLVYPTLDA